MVVEKGSRHSYEAFAQSKVIRGVDSKLASLAPVSQHVVDLASGTGVMVEHLLSQNKLGPRARVFGVDTDPDGLHIAKRKFGPASGIIYTPIEAPVDREIPGIPNGFADLAVFANAIHLTNIPDSLAEAKRILKPGGKLLVSSAYTTEMYPDSSAARFWGILVSRAQKNLDRNKYPDILPPENPTLFSVDQYETALNTAGFTDVKITRETVKMDEEAVLAICDYAGFAEGALPGIKIEDATEALKKAAHEVFTRFAKEDEEGNKYIPRTWVNMEARKPEESSNGATKPPRRAREV